MGRRQDILDTATRLFSQKGFAETSTAEIADQAGVAHGTLFYHFKNKRGIIHEIFAIAGENYLRRLKKDIASESTGIKKIETIIRFNDDYSWQNSQQVRIFQRFFPDLAEQPDPVHDLIAAIQQQVIALITQSLETGVADGTVFCRKIDETARIVNSLIFGITHMHLMAPAYCPNLTREAVEFCRNALSTKHPIESDKNQRNAK